MTMERLQGEPPEAPKLDRGLPGDEAFTLDQLTVMRRRSKRMAESAVREHIRRRHRLLEVKRLNVNATRTSDATLTDVADLSFEAQPGDFWLISVQLPVSIPATPGVRLGWNLQAGATHVTWTRAYADAVAAETVTSTGSPFFNVAAAFDIIEVQASIAIGAVPGSITLQLGQSVSDAGVTTLSTGGYMVAHKLEE